MKNTQGFVDQLQEEAKAKAEAETRHWISEVQRSGYALQHVPEPLRTTDLCLAAIRQNGDALQYIPESLRKHEFYLAAVQRNGDALRYVPESLRTLEIYLAAFQQNGWTLEYVPESLRTPEFFLAAVERNGRSLHDVPESLRTPEFYFAAVQKNGSALRYVPESLKRAIKAEPQSVTLDRAGIRALRLRCIVADVRAIYRIPKADQTPDFLQEAIAANFDVLKSVNRQALLQEGSEGLHEFLDKNWQKVVETLGEPEAAQLAEGIISSSKEDTRERQVA